MLLRLGYIETGTLGSNTPLEPLRTRGVSVNSSRYVISHGDNLQHYMAHFMDGT